MSAPVKSRELVPVRRPVEGDQRLVRNVLTMRAQRGELVKVHSKQELADGRFRYDVTLMEPRLGILVRARRRVLEVVWPASEGNVAKSIRAVLYVLGTGVSVAVGYAVYATVRYVIHVVQATHRYWPALLILAVVIAVAGRKPIAQICHACGRAIH